MNIKAILLAAGFGTRLRPLTDIVPKCLLPINGRPLIEYWLRTLYGVGSKDILINLHHLAGMLEEWLDQSAFAGRVRTVYEDQIMGTGGTLLKNRDFVNDNPVMLIHADNLCLTDFTSYIKAHENRPPGTEITMMTFTTPTPSTCGIVEMDADGVVQAFYEKVADPPGNLANAAVYILQPAVIDFLAGLNKNFIDFSTDVLPHFVGKIYTFHNNVYHRDIGTIESFLTSQWECLDTLTTPVDRYDSWWKFCEKNNGAFARTLLDGLSEGLRMEVIDWTGDNTHWPAYSEGNVWDQRKNIFVLSRETDLPELARYLEEMGISRKDQLIFLPEVHAGFSSKKILDEHGLKCIAVCARATK